MTSTSGPTRSRCSSAPTCRRSRPAIPSGPYAERSGPARLTVVLLALACTVLGYGLATVVSTISSRPNDVDVGFTRDMLTHHDQAMTMSLLLLDKPDIDHLVRDFAFEVLIIQRREVGIMDTYLAEWGKNRGDPDRMSMVWMNMATPIAQMPGMQSDEQMRQLRDATGPDAERLFLTMMPRAPPRWRPYGRLRRRAAPTTRSRRSPPACPATRRSKPTNTPRCWTSSAWSDRLQAGALHQLLDRVPTNQPTSGQGRHNA